MRRTGMHVSMQRLAQACRGRGEASKEGHESSLHGACSKQDLQMPMSICRRCALCLLEPLMAQSRDTAMQQSSRTHP